MGPVTDVMGTTTDSIDVGSILTRAADLVRRGWTQCAWARNVDGERVLLIDDSACSFCASGAIRRAEVDLGYNGSVKYPLSYQVGRAGEAAIRAVRRAAKTPCSIIEWNDGPDRTAREVEEVLLRAAQEIRE